MATATSSDQLNNDDAVDSSENKIKRHHSVEDLNKLYGEGDSCDQVLFSEMRSNLLLVAGEHYAKRDAMFYKRIRDANNLAHEQKLRLVKNHTRKITQTYANNIISMNPNVGFSPKDGTSNHDKKVSELHHSVWRDGWERYTLDEQIDEWCDDFIEVGEAHVKLFWDESIGNLKGYEPMLDDNEDQVVDENGELTPDMEKPVYEGGFVWEKIYGFNLLRPADCRDLRLAEWLGVRKMTDRQVLLLKYPEKQKFIKAGVDETYTVFDASMGSYYKTENQVCVREYYFRPCYKYPRGYFYITTREGILSEGELPAGEFPIKSCLFDKIQTTARGRSPVKQMRPYQIEINRTASKIAEHQVTLGDDKLLTQNGTQLSASASLPGIRGVSYTGTAPTILPGRSGEQYLAYMNSQIQEMYMVMNVAEDSEEKMASTSDPYILLYRSARQKKKFQRYIKKFERFLIEIAQLYINLSKYHLPDDFLIQAIGKNEQINIPEFKEYPNTNYEIKMEAQADDIETKFGQQLAINHALQYVGGQLKPDDIGRMLKQMPYSNFDETFSDMMIDYENLTNDILAMDRGEQPPVGEYDDHIYSIKRLTNRMKQPDYKFLSPQVQNSYTQRVLLHQTMDAQQKAQLQRAEQGFIPTSGYLAKVDFYIPDPKDPSAQPRRLSLPADTIEWVVNQLSSQGTSLASLQGLGQGAASQEAGILTKQTAQPQGAPAPQPGAPPMQRPPMPILPNHEPPGMMSGHGARPAPQHPSIPMHGSPAPTAISMQ